MNFNDSTMTTPKKGIEIHLFIAIEAERSQSAAPSSKKSKAPKLTARTSPSSLHFPLATYASRRATRRPALGSRALWRRWIAASTSNIQ